MFLCFQAMVGLIVAHHKGGDNSSDFEHSASKIDFAIVVCPRQGLRDAVMHVIFAQTL